MPVLVVLGLLALFPVFGATPAAAEEVVCLERSQMVETLVNEYDEQLAAVHEVKGEGLLEIHVSPESGTWTALLTSPAGLSCVLGSGEGLATPDNLRSAAGLHI